MIRTESLNVYFGDFQAIKNMSIDFPAKEVSALIGPSGCGKSTYLRSLNRMNDLIDSCKIEGKVLLGDIDIYNSHTDVVDVRKRIGMVFQKPNPFPKSVYENIAYAPRIHGQVSSRKETDEMVEDCLKRVGLWAEVEDRLHSPGTSLSGGQQQRLCIARAIAVEPDVILMDEPTSALDPMSTDKVEKLVKELKKNYTVVIVTHNMQQAARISDNTAFFYVGELIEWDRTEKLFNNPREKRTGEYIGGKFG